jgi:hypothetical protein
MASQVYYSFYAAEFWFLSLAELIVSFQHSLRVLLQVLNVFFKVLDRFTEMMMRHKALESRRSGFSLTNFSNM